MEESSYTNNKVIEMSKNFVNIVAHSETTHGDTEVIVGREKMKLCTDYYTIPCSVHTKGWEAVGKFFQGQFGTPTTVFADPQGKEISRAAGGLASGELVKKMQEVLPKVTGDKIALPVWQQASLWIKDGDAQLASKQYKKAVELYSKVGKLKGTAFKTMHDEASKKANDAGEELLKEVLALEKVEDKKKALQKIADDFKPLPVSAQAKKELEALK